MSPGSIPVQGIAVSSRTRCAHHFAHLDIIAIKHRCCGQYWACIECHHALSGHRMTVWRKWERPEARAVLCGLCKHELTIDEYLECDDRCTECYSAFRPPCSSHAHLYFEL